MYESIFKRIEEKYLLTKEQYTKLFDIIKDNIEKSKYFETTMCNLYFDTDNNDLIINSIEKPPFKHKVRLRSYGVPNLEDDVFLEMKSKYKNIVGKRRIKLTLKEFYDFYDEKKYDSNDQIMKELDYLFKYYNLKPVCLIAYDRKSYKGINDEKLRITIDTNLRSRMTDLSLELGDNGKLYFDSESYIMEIKTLDAMPLWLVRSLSSLGIYPVSFSKYGSIYIKNREEILC